VNAEQPVTAFARRSPRRRDDRSTRELSKMSASSMTVSPWSEITSGTPESRETAVAYTPFGPKHCTWRTSGWNAATALRSERTDSTPTVAARRREDQLVAGRGIGSLRTTNPSRISAVSASRSSR
jgi:hypothetical protein